MRNVSCDDVGRSNETGSASMLNGSATVARLATVGAMLLFAGNAAEAQSSAPAPAQPVLEFAFEETVTLAAEIPVGATAIGGRNIVPITGGTFEGPSVKGRILPGGWDWQLRRVDGCIQIKADYFLKTDDGVVINVLNQGVACPPEQGVPRPVRTVVMFEPPVGRYSWLGQSVFVGTLVPLRPAEGPAVRIRFYRVR